MKHLPERLLLVSIIIASAPLKERRRSEIIFGIHTHYSVVRWGEKSLGWALVGGLIDIAITFIMGSFAIIQTFFMVMRAPGRARVHVFLERLYDEPAASIIALELREVNADKLAVTRWFYTSLSLAHLAWAKVRIAIDQVASIERNPGAA